MTRYTGEEKRKFVRIPFWFVTKYRVYPHPAGASNEFKHGIGKNVSVGGICFEADDSFDVGTALEVELDMPALEHAVRIIGQVAWTKPKTQDRRGINGLAFTKIAPQDIEAVKMIVDTFA